MITVEWVDEEGAYIVRQDDEFIGDFEEILPAARFALEVAEANGERVVLIGVRDG